MRKQFANSTSILDTAMPPRWMTVLIIAAWLASTAWLCYREFGVYFAPDQPPRYVPDLADEALSSPAPVRWTLYHDGKRLGEATTQLNYWRASDTFELETTLRDVRLNFGLFVGGVAVKVPRMETAYWIDREGSLLGYQSKGDLDIQITSPVLGGSFQFRTETEGEIRDETLTGRRWLTAESKSWDEEVGPIPLSGGTVHSPLEPLPRIRDLEGGQHWRQFVVNPLAESLGIALSWIARQRGINAGSIRLGSEGPKEVYARVDPERVPLVWHDRDVVCWVIRYTAGEAEAGQTWVEAGTGKVLKQTDSSLGITLELIRD